MSAPTILDAVNAFTARKQAGGMNPGEVRIGAELADTLVGTDLTVDELEVALTWLAPRLAGTIGTVAPNLGAALASAWADGFLTGLILADLRAVADRAAE